MPLHTPDKNKINQPTTQPPIQCSNTQNLKNLKLQLLNNELNKSNINMNITNFDNKITIM